MDHETTIQPLGYTIVGVIDGKTYVGDDKGDTFFESTDEARAYVQAAFDEAGQPLEDAYISSLQIVALVPVAVLK